MSWDLSVWYPDRRLTDAQAGERYGRLCEGQAEGEVVSHPAVQAFYTELTSMHPEIDDVPVERVDDTEHCPWSIAMDRSSGHVIMSCVHSRADYVRELVRGLARKHGLAVYDPQQGRVSHPDDGGVSPAARTPWWKPWS
jgi:hypothetical protein